MDETPREPPLAPGERIEHHEVTQRVPADGEPVPARRGSPMWPWLVPLVLLVLFLAWYIFTRGEPSSPIDAVDDVEVVTPDIDVEP
jgi:hypothetical protein